MRVLIVGCGYVGSALGARLVREGHEVFGLRRNPESEPELRAAGIHPLFADLTRQGQLDDLPHGYDWVVHCVAAGGGMDHYREIYFDGTSRLLEWLAKDPPRKMVYTSSTSVYGQTDGAIVNEESPVEPEAETSKILVATEHLLLRAVAAGPRTAGIPAVILRTAGIYGPGRGHGFKLFLTGQARIEGRGSRFMNMIHRDDVAGCILAALRTGRPGQIYNAVDHEPVSQWVFYEWLAATLGKALPPAESAVQGRRRGITNKRVSNAKLLAELGYTFQFPDFRAGYTAEIERLKTAGGL